jgi:probable F420-dependent oxidoreductase
MPGELKFGLTQINTGAYSYPATMVRVAQAAESAGFDSVWASEHVVLPDAPGQQSYMAPEHRILNPVVALTFIAAHTSTIRLGTGVIILPQHHPLVLAKELASLDVLSNGRVIFGVGVSRSEPEFRAMGVPFEDRGRRTDEYLAAIRAIWIEPKPAYHGQFVSFANIQAYPHPLQQPYPPIVIGGRSPAAYRRAVEVAHGWYGFSLDLEETAHAIADLRQATRRYPRPEFLGELEISVAPRIPIDLAVAERFAELGVHRLILIPRRSLDGPALEEYIATVGSTLIGRI